MLYTPLNYFSIEKVATTAWEPSPPGERSRGTVPVISVKEVLQHVSVFK